MGCTGDREGSGGTTGSHTVEGVNRTDTERLGGTHLRKGSGDSARGVVRSGTSTHEGTVGKVELPFVK